MRKHVTARNIATWAILLPLAVVFSLFNIGLFVVTALWLLDAAGIRP